MSRTITPEHKKRLLNFFIELHTMCEKKQAVSFAELVETHGIPYRGFVAQTLISHKFVDKIASSGKRAIYRSNFKCDEHTVDLFLSAASQVTKEAREGRDLEKHYRVTSKVKRTPLAKQHLSKFTDRTLMAELRARGYRGNLEKVVHTTVKV